MQIVLWIANPGLNQWGSYQFQQYEEPICWVLTCQYFLRMYFIFIRGNRMIETTGLVNHNGWAGATYYISLYLLGSHVSTHVILHLLIEH